MTLEWLRRRDPALDRVLRQYLFTDDAVIDIEHGDAPPGPADPAGTAATPSTSLRIGSLAGKEAL